MATIAHRRAVDRIRTVSRSAARDHAWARLNRVPDRDDEISRRLDRQVAVERVQHGMSSVSPAQREALRLTYLVGYSPVEVAALLQVPLGTVKTRIRDGLIRMRRTIAVDPLAQAPLSPAER